VKPASGASNACKDFEGEDGKCVGYFCAIPVGTGRRVLHGKQDSTKNNKFYFKDLEYLSLELFFLDLIGRIDRPFEFHCQQRDITYKV
jgi:hypothetical protein